jgi:hypothetical protein
MKHIATLAVAAAAIAAVSAQAQPGPEQRGAPAPAGSYWQTCRNVSTYGYGRDAMITAQCRDERGRWRGTSLRFGDCREIENRNGDLVCRDQGGGRPPWGGGPGGGRPPWGGGGRSSIAIYSAPDFGGQPFEARDEITNLPKQYNDRAMSLRIQGRGSWQVCADSDFRGRCQVFDRDVRDLRQYGLGEAVSSMRPVR